MNRTRILLAASAMMLGTICSADAQAIYSAGSPYLAGSTLVDFSAAPAGQFPSYTEGNAGFAAGAGQSLLFQSTYSGQYNTSGQYLTNAGYSFSNMRFDFAAGTSAFGFQFGASDINWSLDSYDASNNLLGTVVIGPPTRGSNVGDFFGFHSSGGAISYALLSHDVAAYQAQFGGTYDYVMVDEFRYQEQDTETTPEPASLVLMATGLAGVIAVRRRRKA